MEWEDAINALQKCRKCGSDNVCYDEKLFLAPERFNGVVLKYKAVCLDCNNHTKWYEKESQATKAWNKEARSMSKAKSFDELTSRNWCTGQYYKVLPGCFCTDGVKDFIESFDAGWAVTEMLISPTLLMCKYGHFPYIKVADNDKGQRMVEFYYGKVDDMGEDDKNEKAFKSVEDLCKCLPVGTLRFEVGFGDPEGKTHILALMSEH